MKIGYARVSSSDQNLDRQIHALKKAGVDKIFQEKLSGKNTKDRPEFLKALNFARQGDTFIVSSLDRLSRDYDDVGMIINRLQKDKITLQVLDAPFLTIKTGDDTLDQFVFEIMTKLMAYIAQSERQRIKSRQREGINLAKQRGVYKGGTIQYSADSPNPQKRFMYEKIKEMIENGVTISDISRTTGLTRTTIYRIKDRIKS